MTLRTLILPIVSLCTLLFAASPQSKEQVDMTTVKQRLRARAVAKVTVQSSEAKPYDQTAAPALLEMRMSETFTGDIDGESTVRALQVLRDDRSACFVSMQ
jgi:hypothetical protein